jgi:hypothetical protein
MFKDGLGYVSCVAVTGAIFMLLLSLASPKGQRLKFLAWALGLLAAAVGQFLFSLIWTWLTA